MGSRFTWRAPAALAATLVLTAAMVTGAVVSVLGAGCPDPGRLVTRTDGTLELVGGCISARDLVVPGAPLSTLPDGFAPNVVRP